MKLFAAIVVALAGACEKDAGPAQDRCELHITGDETADVVVSVPRGTRAVRARATSFYWMTDQERRDSLRANLPLYRKYASPAELDQAVEERMREDSPDLNIYCGDDHAFVAMAPPKARRADVPFVSGTYRLIRLSEAEAGDFVPAVLIFRGASEDFFIDEAGTLDLTRFNRGGISGTFHFTAKQRHGTKAITVDGRFDFGCVGGRCR